MKHKLYERWILDEMSLTRAQQQKLASHLHTCKSCLALQTGWTASKKLISLTATHQPATGFSDRWQQTIIKKSQIEKVRRYRLTIFGLVLLAFASTLTYTIASGSLMQTFANGIAVFSNVFMKITNGLSSIGYWLNHLPIVVPLTAGFAFFGLLTAFMMSGIFFLWNIRKRKLQPNEI